MTTSQARSNPSLLRRFSAVTLIPLAAALTLSACGEQSAKNSNYESPAPITAPAGDYAIDNTHAIVAFQVKHLGLSNYIARFNDYDITLSLNPDDMSKSSVNGEVRVASIDTGYTGNYKATHKDSPFKTWDEDLSMSPKWLNGKVHPTITYRSTSVKAEGNGYRIDGELTLLGVTKQVPLKAVVSGSLAEHPFSKKGAIGFSAEGSFKRSDFGMTYLTQPGFIGDEVSLIFEGEFHAK